MCELNRICFLSEEWRPYFSCSVNTTLENHSSNPNFWALLCLPCLSSLVVTEHLLSAARPNIYTSAKKSCHNSKPKYGLSFKDSRRSSKHSLCQTHSVNFAVTFSSRLHGPITNMTVWQTPEAQTSASYRNLVRLDNVQISIENCRNLDFALIKIFLSCIFVELFWGEIVSMDFKGHFD